MDRTQQIGVMIMAGAVVQMLLFTVALLKRSYWAIALPMAAAVTGISALAVWVGWTMMTAETDLPDADEENEAPA